MFTFGSDPEFMIQDANGTLKSAIGIVPGKKENRYDLGGSHEAYYDNVLAECSIKPGASKEEVVANFRDCFKRFADLIAPNRLVPMAATTFPKKECEHPDALVFGCDPEFCAYDVSVCRPPDCESTFRSAGGHVHLGYDGGANLEGDEEANYAVAWNRINVARMCDVFLGLPSLFMDHDPQTVARKKLYGKAGRHRPCPAYGVEYRTMGNFWLSSPRLVELVYDLGKLAVDTVKSGEHDEIWEEALDPDILKDAIDNGNLKAGTKLMKVVSTYLSDDLNNRIKSERDHTDPYNFYAEWKL